MWIFCFGPFFIILLFLEENAWAQEENLESLLLSWQTAQTPPTSSEYLLDDGGTLPQSGNSLLAQVDQQQYPNSLIDHSPAQADNSWQSNQVSDCVPDNARRAARRWKKRDQQQPAMCSPSGSTNITPKISPNFIKNPSLPVTPTEPEQFRIPVFPGSSVHKGDNPSCVQRTLGWLPLGICDSGVEADRHESIYDVYGIAATLASQGTTGLENCVPGASFFTCPTFFLLIQFANRD